MFNENDRVRFKAGVNQAYGPPDRRNKIGTVESVINDGTAIRRISVLFDGEDAPTGGMQEGLFEPA